MIRIICQRNRIEKKPDSDIPHISRGPRTTKPSSSSRIRIHAVQIKDAERDGMAPRKFASRRRKTAAFLIFFQGGAACSPVLGHGANAGRPKNMLILLPVSTIGSSAGSRMGWKRSNLLKCKHILCFLAAGTFLASFFLPLLCFSTLEGQEEPACASAPLSS